MRRVFITGASSGLGWALALEYARRGARLGLVARREDKLQALLRELPNASLHLAYAIDVNDHAALRDAAQDFILQAGGTDVVIANAGISYGTLTERSEDLAVFEHIIQTNLVATVATFAPFIDTMKAQAAKGNRDLRLVGIASVAGVRGMPGAEAYSASKAAVISYCESLRVELGGQGIRVVTIAPGYIDTPMTKVNTYPMPFLMPAHRFARSAVSVIERGRSYAVIPWPMRGVSWLLKLLPNGLFDAVFARAGRKPSFSELNR
jgi:short-subunit dehydrogenase